MPQDSGRTVLDAFGRGVRHPVSLIVAAIVGVGAIAAPIVIVPGLVLWGLISWVIGQSGEQMAEEIETGDLPPSLQSDLAKVESALEDLRAAVAQLDPGQRELFAGVEDETIQLRRAAARLARTAGELHERIAQEPPARIRERLESLQKRLEAAEAEDERGRLLQEIEDLEVRLERREEEMERLENQRATLDEMASEIRGLARRIPGYRAGA